MVKKIFGAVCFILAVYTVLTTIAEGSLFSARGIFSLVSAAANLLAGVFFFFFDKVYTLSFEEGFKKRKGQNLVILLFTLIYAFMILYSAVSASLTGSRSAPLLFVISVLPLLLPFFIFAGMIGVYVAPFSVCKKQFELKGEKISSLLGEEFSPINKKGAPRRSKKALFFHKYFCIVPFEKIAAVKLVKSIDSTIVFTLKNGKKLELTAGKKQFDGIEAAINDYRLHAEEEEE